MGSLLNSFLAEDEVNNLNDNVVNDDLNDIVETVPGPDVSIAYNEDFGNSNKESEIDWSSFKKGKNSASLLSTNHLKSKAGSTKDWREMPQIFLD